MNCSTGSLYQKKKLHILHRFFFGMGKRQICLCPRHIGRRIGGVRVQLHSFLISTLGGGAWTASRTGRFHPRERAPKTDWTEAWVGSRADLDALRGNLLPLTRTEPRFLSRTARGVVAIETELSPNSANRLILTSIRVAIRGTRLTIKTLHFDRYCISVTCMILTGNSDYMPYQFMFLMEM
jgi:hypothetical protein